MNITNDPSRKNNDISSDRLEISSYWDLNTFSIDDTGNGDYTWSQAVLEPWCNGSGTYSTPYIIQNITINAGNRGTALDIRYSNLYFIVRNSLFQNSQELCGGINLFHTINGIIIGNEFSNNHGYGLKIHDCDNLTVDSNRFINNDFFYGTINVEDSNNITLINNEVFNSEGIDLNIGNCFDNIISGNSFLNGMDLDGCSRSMIIRNHIINLDWAALDMQWGCDNNIIQNNTIKGEAGVYLYRSDNNILINNDIEYKSDCVLEEECAGNLIENNQCSEYNDKKQSFEYINGSQLLFIISMLGLTSIVLTIIKIKKIKIK